MESRFHIALPVRLTTWDSAQRPIKQMVCTLDISFSGARLAGVQGVKAGETVLLKRLTNEAMFRVVWAGKTSTSQQGQIAVECVETGKTIWDVDFAELEEEYEAMPVNPDKAGSSAQAAVPANRFSSAGIELQLASGASGIEAKLRSLALHQCEIETRSSLPHNADIELQIQVEELRVRAKGTVRKTQSSNIYAVEFSHIRRGDMPVLQSLLAA